MTRAGIIYAGAVMLFAFFFVPIREWLGNDLAFFAVAVVWALVARLIAEIAS
jgi:hypothetical protein